MVLIAKYDSVELDPEELYKRFVDAKVAAAAAAMPPDAIPASGYNSKLDKEDDEHNFGVDCPVAMDANHPLWMVDEDSTECADCGALW